MKRREIIFPHVLYCCKYASEDFWKTLFEDLAYGKSPYGTYIFKDTICCTNKNVNFYYKIDPKKDPQIIYEELIEQFNKNLNIYSFEELKERKQVYDSTISNRDEWKTIRKKNVKDQIIEEFVIDNMKTYELCLPESKKLLSIIILAFQFKFLSNKDIEYSDKKIVSIDGISFDTNTVLYSNKFTNTFIDTN